MHGEDVKELYFYLDSSPTHDYMRALYKYPQNAFPYDELRDKSAEGQVSETEYELTDTGETWGLTLCPLRDVVVIKTVYFCNIF